MKVYVERFLVVLVLIFAQTAMANQQDWLINQEVGSKQKTPDPDSSEPASSVGLTSKTQQEERSPASAGIQAAPNPAVSLETAEEITRQIQQNQHAYRDLVRQHWARPVWSDAANWITYNDDFSVRRWVDYEQNEIKISLKSSEKRALSRSRQQATEELTKLLKTQVRDAIANDPLLASMEQLLTGLNGADWAQELVLGELFSGFGSKQEVSEGELAALTQKLMSNAELRFSENKALGVPAVGVPLSSAVTFFIPMPSQRLLRRAQSLKSDIKAHASALSVPEDLVFSVIHTESHFNPLARSLAPAYGLMQVVPRTAGRDATQFLFKQPQLLTPVDLFQPNKNIQIGTAYLSLLYSHYLQGVTDKLSRWYCTVAAYNTGVSNVARAFGGAPRLNEALPRINGLTAEQVLSRLLRHLPAEETRQYLQKVMARRIFYNEV